MDHAPDRTAYRPSGRCDPARLPAALALLAAAVGGIAALYGGMLAVDFYFSGFSALLPAVTAAVGIRAAVKRGHWRNPVLAGAVGAACGLASYLAYFHADQCLRWRVPWAAVERLPGYVIFRMETDRWHRMDRGAILRPQKPAAGVRPQRPLARADFRSWNWAGFAFEVLVLAGVPLGAGVVTARAPYSERRRRWCSCERLTLAPESGSALRQALADGTVAAWVEAGPRKVGGHEKHVKVAVWYTPAREGEEPDPDVFVTVGEGRPWRLHPEEAAALVQLLPAMQDLAGPSLPQLAAEAERSGDPTSARVWPVPAPYAGQAYGPRTRLQNRCLLWGLTLLPGLVVFLALPGGVWLLGTVAVERKLLPLWGLAVYVVVVALSCVALVRWWYRPGHLVPLRLLTWLGCRRLRRALAGRPEPLVAADDARAVFAEMVPRRVWGTGGGPPGESCQGLLLADAARGVLLFEGDHVRYSIPAAAVLACDVESHPDTAATTASPWLVVVRARLGSGTWEFPFYPMANVEGGGPWERATSLRRRIEAVCGRRLGEVPAAPPQDPGPVVV